MRTSNALNMNGLSLQKQCILSPSRTQNSVHQRYNKDQRINSLAITKKQKTHVCQVSAQESTPTEWFISTLGKEALEKLQNLTRRRAFSRWAAVTIMLLEYSIGDAGFSGDWSRIGILTHEQELVCRFMVLDLLILNAFTTALVYKDIKAKKAKVAQWTLKVFCCGLVGVAEIIGAPYPSEINETLKSQNQNQ